MISLLTLISEKIKALYNFRIDNKIVIKIIIIY